MSSIAITGGATGTGVFSLVAPSTSTNRTLTLPDATGTVLVSGNGISGTTGTFSGDLSFNSGYGSAAVGYGCRAWVNFNGTGTVAIRGTGNVSSITDNGIGDYTVNFTTALVDANYSVVAMGTYGEMSNRDVGTWGGTDQTASLMRLAQRNTTGTASDSAYVSVAVFR